MMTVTFQLTTPNSRYDLMSMDSATNKKNPRSTQNIRYVLRPQNMTDPISLQSTKDINIPIGNYNGDKLKNKT